MEQWQERVVDEAFQLDARMARLTAFRNESAFWELQADDRFLLVRQHMAMHEYSEILWTRIRKFKRVAEIARLDAQLPPAVARSSLADLRDAGRP